MVKKLITLTACQNEVAFMIVQWVEAELHGFANNSDVTPSNVIHHLWMLSCRLFEITFRLQKFYFSKTNLMVVHLYMQLL